jgi:hypothetical protein
MGRKSVYVLNMQHQARLLLFVFALYPWNKMGLVKVSDNILGAGWISIYLLKKIIWIQNEPTIPNVE